jgi:hypothetical protein
MVALLGCGPQAAPVKPEAPAAAAPAGPNAATLAAQVIVAEDAMDQAAASVNKVAQLERGDAKFFSTVGGDPAINGEYVFLALIDNPHDGWKVFKVGDFNSWSLVEQDGDRAVLQVSHSAIDQASGDVVTAEQRIAVTVPKFDATQINVTPVE